MQCIIDRKIFPLKTSIFTYIIVPVVLLTRCEIFFYLSAFNLECSLLKGKDGAVYLLIPEDLHNSGWS